MAKRVLGKGLDALFQTYEEIDKAINENEITELKISDIDPNLGQPRKQFDDKKINELAQSIKTHGVVQPIIVKQNEGRYLIIAGERRWRAARIAGLARIPAIIREFEDREIIEIALIENLQREDLNPIEESLGIKALMDEYQLTQEQVAERIGRSRPAIANSLRLLSLPGKIQEYLISGELTTGHARALIAIQEDNRKIEVAEEIIAKGLNVRQTEEIIKTLKDEAKKVKEKAAKPNYIIDIEATLEERLGTRVIINPGKKKGIIEIEYYNNEDLERIMDMITEK